MRIGDVLEINPDGCGLVRFATVGLGPTNGGLAAPWSKHGLAELNHEHKSHLAASEERVSPLFARLSLLSIFGFTAGARTRKGWQACHAVSGTSILKCLVG